MRKFAAMLAGAMLAATAPGVASAATYFNYVANVGGDFGNPDPTKYPPLFNDTYDFTTAFARTVTIEIVSSMSTPTAWSENVNFVSNGVKLDAKLIPATETGTSERRYLANFRLPAGPHQILVRGSAGENGAYTGVLTLAGVPEPATWGLMILGFGMTGAAMRRRQAKVAMA